MNQCSDLFSEVFDSHCSGIVRTCSCGKTFYNADASNLFDDGEFEDLERKSKQNPDSFIGVNGNVYTMEIDGKQIVYGCSCDTAKRYESFILNHSIKLAQYLKKYAVQLREKADMVDVDKEE